MWTNYVESAVFLFTVLTYISQGLITKSCICIFNYQVVMHISIIIIQFGKSLPPYSSYSVPKAWLTSALVMRTQNGRYLHIYIHHHLLVSFLFLFPNYGGPRMDRNLTVSSQN